MARSVLFEIDLARANAKLPAGAISAVTTAVRELLADFRLGERLRFDLAVNQATLVMSVSIAGSGQWVLRLSLSKR